MSPKFYGPTPLLDVETHVEVFDVDPSAQIFKPDVGERRGTMAHAKRPALFVPSGTPCN